VDALWHLYLFVGVMGGVGMSSFYLLSASTVTRWFDEGRGLALALVLVGFNLGYIAGGPLAAWLIARVGWRGAYALLGSGCGLLTMLAALTVRLPRAAGVVSDRRGTITTIRVAYVIETLALVTLLWIPSREALLASLVMFGAGFAASDTMIVKVIPDVFGMRALGAIMGVLTLGWR